MIDQFSKVKVKKMKPLIRSLMRMSVYQLLYMDKTMDAAVCNEAVKLASKRGFQSLKGFVNGVLRTIARNKENIVYPDVVTNPLFYLSVRYSMPEWIVSLWMEQLGFEETERVLQGLIEKRPLMIRMDEGMKDAEKTSLLEAFRKEHIDLEQLPTLPYAYLVKIRIEWIIFRDLQKEKL